MSSPVVFSAEPGKAKWPDVSTACLKDKLKFCFLIFFKTYPLTSCFFFLVKF